jgi:hypothetical protein
MNTKTFLGLLASAWLVTCPAPAQDSSPQRSPSSNPPERPDRELTREAIRAQAVEQRKALERDLREQFAARDDQNPDQAGQRPGFQAREQLPPLGGGTAGIGRVLMVLTAEQRKSLLKAFEPDHSKVLELERKLRQARRAAMEISLAKEFKEGDLRDKLEAAAQMDTELTIIRARAMASIQPPLSSEQLDQIKIQPAAENLTRTRQDEGLQPDQPATPPPGKPSKPNEPGDYGHRPPPPPL